MIPIVSNDFSVWASVTEYNWNTKEVVTVHKRSVKEM